MDLPIHSNMNTRYILCAFTGYTSVLSSRVYESSFILWSKGEKRETRETREKRQRDRVDREREREREDERKEKTGKETRPQGGSGATLSSNVTQ